MELTIGEAREMAELMEGIALNLERIEHIVTDNIDLDAILRKTSLITANLRRINGEE